MKPSRTYEGIGVWLEGSGPLGDIVISSRVRLARNVAGFLFFSQAEAQEQAELLHFVRDKVMATELKKDLQYIDMEEASPLERALLAERHVISRQMAEGDGARGVALAHDESLAVMINEEDHLRMQWLSSGLQLEETYARINRVDDLLEGQMDYAFSPQYGYLTACPTNVGTGVRVSVMLHLPALKMTGQMDKVFRAAKDMRLAVRGLYGEGSEPIGDFYQLSNQTSLGKSEQQIIHEVVNDAVTPIVQYERRARQLILEEKRAALDDKIFRALGVLRSARLISSEEALYMLSYLRLGIHLNRIKDVSLGTVNRLFLFTQPAHLQQHYQQKLETPERDEVRAEFIRKELR
jgi:protein arginine kinase